MSQKSRFLGAGLGAALLLCSAGCSKLQSRDEMNKGVQSYKNNKYPDAVQHFKEAVQLDPTNDNAQLYLATSYMTQWVPGADSPDNKKNYDAARQEFENILKREPTNSHALESMAFMAFNAAQSGTPEQKTAALEEARKWNQRRIEVDPKDSGAYYYLGVIDWTQAFPPIRDARIAGKMTATDPGPIKDAKVRGDLKARYGSQIDQGIGDLTKCLALDKENEDAMSYINLLYRSKANLEDSVDAAKADTDRADKFINDSIETKKMKAARPAKKTEAS